MTNIFFYNTLTRKKEKFRPLSRKEVGLYTCGPTVYNFAHLGNLRTYLFEDILRRVLEYSAYRVKHVMNITDVGHLTGDMDMGEDKLELGAKREGKSAWQIAEFYTAAFRRDIQALNIQEPAIWCRATDNIPEQIDLIKVLEKKGYTYLTSDGVYFNTAKFKGYNKLSHLPLEKLKEGARVEKNPDKKNPTDFSLWKFSPRGAKRQMEWPSPWGVGFPGWHIECSAMSLKFLGKSLDIHCGGIDHINIHHTNEIAQSEAATGRAFFRFWLHGAFLNIKGGKKMAKSADNFLTLENTLLKNNLSPLAYRFAALQVHYRKPMEYSETGLKQAQAGLDSLWHQIAALGNKRGEVNSEYKEKFQAAISDDLNMAKALAVLAALLKSKLSPADKLATALDFDQVFGLSFDQCSKKIRNKASEFLLSLVEAKSQSACPANIQKMIVAREAARAAKDWAKADAWREKIKEAGYLLEDSPTGVRAIKL